jgi:hypothetical protein
LAVRWYLRYDLLGHDLDQILAELAPTWLCCRRWSSLASFGASR